MILSNIEGIGKWSKYLIKVRCDECSIEKEIEYKLYTSYGYSDGDWFCRKCKTKKNNLEKWGVENPFQLEEIKEKIKRTNLEKWGVENPSQNQEINKKIKESISKLDKEEINNKRSKTVNIKYGVDNVAKLKEVKNKKIESYQRKL
jgi:rubredoxin